MLNLSKEKTIQEHRKMWNWIADEIEKRNEIVTKNDYFNEVYTGRCPSANCFLCDYAGYAHNITCASCILKWPRYNCGDVFSPYIQYCEAIDENDIIKAYTTAREIANLPEREE